MSSRLSILAGLLVGIAVAALVLGAIVAFAPDPVPPSSPPSSVAPSGAGTGTYRVGQAAPRVDGNGVVRHRAFGGIAWDVIVSAPRSVLPRVDVTP
jgi:hypothetical protein